MLSSCQQSSSRNSRTLSTGSPAASAIRHPIRTDWGMGAGGLDVPEVLSDGATASLFVRSEPVELSTCSGSRPDAELSCYAVPVAALPDAGPVPGGVVEAVGASGVAGPQCGGDLAGGGAGGRVCRAVGFWVARRLASNPGDRERVLHRYGQLRTYHIFLLLGVYAASLYLLGWGWTVQQICGQGASEVPVPNCSCWPRSWRGWCCPGSHSMTPNTPCTAQRIRKQRTRSGREVPTLGSTYARTWPSCFAPALAHFHEGAASPVPCRRGDGRRHRHDNLGRGADALPDHFYALAASSGPGPQALACGTIADSAGTDTPNA